MPRKKRASKEPDNIRGRLPGDGSTDAPPPDPKTIGGVNVAGGNIITHHIKTGLSAAEIDQLFGGLYAAVETLPNTSMADREDLKSEIKEIQSTVTEAVMKNEKVDEGFLSRRFRNIARMAPDMLDIVVATLGNPSIGLGVVVRKIAAKAITDAPPSDRQKKE